MNNEVYTRMLPIQIRIFCAIAILFMSFPLPVKSNKNSIGTRSNIYVMKVDYNPSNFKLCGLCKINGKPCWLQLDTGWVGVALYKNKLSNFQTQASKVSKTPQNKKSEKFGPMAIELCNSNRLRFLIKANVLSNSSNAATSNGQTISGILGIPFLNILPTEWNVPAHKIVFWLKGRPDEFTTPPRSRIVICKQDSMHRLIIPVSVRNRHGYAYLDTGTDGIYLFDAMISNFPKAGPEEVWVGPNLKFHFIPRQVKNLKIGALSLTGIVGGRLPKHPTKGSAFPYGLFGMSIVSQIHFFVTGNKIVFGKNYHSSH